MSLSTSSTRRSRAGSLPRFLKKLPKEQEIVAYCRGPYCLLAYEAVAKLRRKGCRARRIEDGFLERGRAAAGEQETGLTTLPQSLKAMKLAPRTPYLRAVFSLLVPANVSKNSTTPARTKPASSSNAR